jgi:hypothetical protein
MRRFAPFDYRNDSGVPENLLIGGPFYDYFFFSSQGSFIWMSQFHGGESLVIYLS